MPEDLAAASPLELLHPAGHVERVLVDGTRCPESLLPRAARAAQTSADLAIVAPAPAQLARRGGLERSIAAACRALAPDGILYAVLPPVARAAARRHLRAAGLEPDGALAHFPGSAPRHLVPLEPGAWRHMLGAEIGAHARVRRGLLVAGALPFGQRLLAEVLPTVGLIARPRGAAPLCAWIEQLGSDVRPTAHVAALTSWRGHAGPVVLFCFSENEDAPWGVVKVAPGAQREANQLELLGAEARAAGARLPRVLGVGAVAGRHALVETAVDGRPAARLLMSAPDRFGEVAVRLADWLERWNSATTRPAVQVRERLEHDLLRHDLPSSYRERLTETCAALADETIPVVAAHHDLTMWNVRISEGGELGVLDWAEAEADALPLTDLFYGLADAAAACDGYRDRVAAARTCFERGGARAPTVAPLVERLRESLQLSPAVAELCFHACWLRHAANEAERQLAERPFGEIVSWLAQRAGAL